MSDVIPIRRALLSVSDKSGLLDLAAALAALTDVTPGTTVVGYLSRSRSCTYMNEP